MSDPSINAATVLIVDDEESVLHVVKRYMERGGFRVRTAADGRAAVRVFGEANAAIDAVLLDMTMPGMDGEEVYRELVKIKPGILVFLASGLTGADVASHFKPGEIAAFIQKPYRLEAMVSQIRAAIQTTRAP